MSLSHKLNSRVKFSIGEGVFVAYWSSMNEITHAPLGPGKYLCADGYPLIELKDDAKVLFLNTTKSPVLEVGDDD